MNAAELISQLQTLPADEVAKVREWLNEQAPESPELLAAIDEADRSFAAEGGVSPEEIRRKLKTWTTG